jgi:hypothetical protein
MSEDSYKVRMEITTPIKGGSDAKKKPTYKILEVVHFDPGSPMRQQDLF